MITSFTRYQRKEDVKPCLDDDSKLVYPICENILFAAKKCIDPFEEDCCVYNKNQSTIVGFYVKQIRLFEEFFDSYKFGKLNLCVLYQRIIYEAYLKMLYLIKYGDDAQTEYRLYSYKDRKAFYDKYKDVRDGYYDVRNKKFLLDLSDDGFTIEDLATKDKAFGGKNVRQLFGEFEDDSLYSTLYGMASDSIHSDWGELRQIYLTKTENGWYLANEEETSPIPFRYLIPMSDLIIESSKHYIEWNQKVDDKLKIMLAYSSILEEMKRVCSLVMEFVFDTYQTSPNNYMTE
jgi:hypothetical protein